MKTMVQRGSEKNVGPCLQMPAVIARYGGKPELVAKAYDASRTHQDHGDTRVLSIAFARMLERVLLGQSVAVRPYTPDSFLSFLWSCLPGISCFSTMLLLCTAAVQA